MANFKLAENVSVLTDFADGYAVYDARYALAGHAHDHDDLTGLSDDDHAHYALLAGRSGGQTLKGGTASGDDLTLSSTNHATKGSIFFGAAATSVYDEVNDRWAFGTTTFTSGFKLKCADSVLVESNANNPGFVVRDTQATSASLGPQNGFIANDGAAIESGHRIGTLLFNAYDGSAERLGAAIIVTATQLWSGSARGNQIAFLTTPNGSTTIATGLVVEHDGTATITNHANVGGEYRVDNTRVVGNRITGWGAPTGTATRTTFATGAVTLAQLAERVKALIDDLTTHGLIGA